MEIMKAVLGLEDGEFVVGEGFGVEGFTYRVQEQLQV